MTEVEAAGFKSEYDSLRSEEDEFLRLAKQSLDRARELTRYARMYTRRAEHFRKSREDVEKILYPKEHWWETLRKRYNIWRERHALKPNSERWPLDGTQEYPIGENDGTS